MTQKIICFSDQLNFLEKALIDNAPFSVFNNTLNHFLIDEQPTTQQLGRTVSILYPLLLKSLQTIEQGDERSVYWQAEKWFHQILFDKDAERKQWIKNSLEHYLERRLSLSEFLNDYSMPSKASEPKQALDEIFKHYKYLPAIIVSWSDDEAYEQLTPYFDWLTQQLVNKAEYHYKISWEVLLYSQAPIKAAFKKWWGVLEEQSLVESDFVKHIELAHYWYKRREDVSSLTSVQFHQLVTLLDNPNPILRGVAARCIGATYVDWLDGDEFQGNTEIPIVEMMALLYEKQKVGNNVVGGFIDGVSADGSLQELEQHLELVKQSFDVKAWVLTVATTCPEYEPYIPGSQAFWFYVHEYLDFDPLSVKKLIDHKRYWLAMMCATESDGAYEKMKPLLKVLIDIAPASVAEQCQRHIAVKEGEK